MVSNAQSANNLIAAAKYQRGWVDPGEVRAGTYKIDVRGEEVSRWHSHDLHQLEYAFEGTAEVQTEAARFLLPPQQAVWIPAGLAHASTLRHVKGVSVFFHPSLGLPAGDRVRIVAASPLLKEMLHYADRWPIGRDASDPMADAFFVAMAYVVAEWLDHETPLRLPRTRHPVVAAAMAYTDECLGSVTFNEVCRATATSERSLRRAFLAEVGMSWRQYVHESRLLKAMVLLAEEGCSVLSVATAVGFQSVSAFTRAFALYVGETPSAYRHRVGTDPRRGGSEASVVPNAADNDVLAWSHPEPDPTPQA